MIKGVRLSSSYGKVSLKVAGYADDTDVYLRNPSEAPTLLELAEEYGAVSGLRLNDGKTLVVPLSELTWSHHKRMEQMLPDGLAAISPGDFARYLGIQAGPGIAAEESWTIAVRQLRIRLNLAMRKTLTVERGDDCGGDHYSETPVYWQACLT
ncbi:Reverse transcriptase precursor [Phytophthora megakarya]|uniref:Reverse transcriptase n=1 Tax=Phytophthora megakarya TaxID=4795 RepID=A0A225UNA9_9STRA|nr:Reverse transcriptase precursor [Phytophthora megakarya]